MPESPRSQLPPDFDLERFVVDVAAKARELSRDVGDIFRDWMDEAKYRVDREVGRQLAKHPELYADLRRLGRKFRRAWEK